MKEAVKLKNMNISTHMNQLEQHDLLILVLKHFEVSAKTGKNINEAFDYMLQAVLEKMKIIDEQGNILYGQNEEDRAAFKLRNKKRKKKKCCKF